MVGRVSSGEADHAVPLDEDVGRQSRSIYGCSPGCLLLSLAVSVLLTILINILIWLL